MAELSIELELQGFKLKIRGSKDDVPGAMQQLGQQMSGLITPIPGIIDAEVVDEVPAQRAALATPIPPSVNGKPRRRKKKSGASGAGDDTSGVVQFKHEPERWGNPKQEWKSWQKAMWLMNVLKEAIGTKEFTAKTLADTFNLYFKSAGAILTHNVARDLAKRKEDLLIGEDPGAGTSRFYVTDKGTEYAKKLVEHALGRVEAVPEVE